jgi:hypothetical protein
MEYRFQRTLNGPVLVGEDEVLFLHENGAIEDYIDSDPDYYDKALAFIQETISEYGQMLAKGITEGVPGIEYAMNIMSYWTAADHLHRSRDHRMQIHHQDNPPV